MNPNFTELRIKESSITLRGLATVWQLPLPIKTLVCDGYNFKHGNDDVIDVKTLMQCPNGPSVLTDLSLNWGSNRSINPGNKARATIREMLFKSNVLFPNLKRMLWNIPTEDLFASGQKWEAVEAFNQVSSSKLKLGELAMNFPNVISMSLSNITPLTASLEIGSFDFLTRFEFRSSRFQDTLPFMTFRAILAKAKNIFIVIIVVSSLVVDQYSDEPFCHMLHTIEHLKNLEWLELLSEGHHMHSKINLTQTSVSCILNTCNNIRMLGDLRYWNVDPESVLHHNKGYDLNCQQLCDVTGHQCLKVRKMYST